MRFVTVHNAELGVTTTVPESRVPHMAPGWERAAAADPAPVRRAPSARKSRRATRTRAAESSEES